VRWAGFAAACTVAATLAACANSESYDLKAHELVVTVRSAAQDPVANVNVKAWILDADVPGDSRAPIELEPQVTDAQGRAEWTYEAFDTPYFCGYEVRASDGSLLTQAAPLVSERLNAASGQLTVVLP
jgi:hypothetical protein